MSDCLFCRIAARTIPAKILAETPEAVAFHDLQPQAPVHVLVIPRKHIPTLNDLQPDDAALVGKLFLLAKDVAAALKIDAPGWRAVFNTNSDARQSVFHVHLHVLGGRRLDWPPG
jgi:histidine triad (HIT) family protein